MSAAHPLVWTSGLRRFLPILLPPALAALLWRLNAQWPQQDLLLWSALLALLVCVGTGLAWGLWSRREAAVRDLAALAGLSALVAALGLIPDLWPCEACSGIVPYETIAGLPLLPMAMAGYLALATIASCQAERDRLPVWIQAIAWAMVGASGYYLWLSWRIDVLCSHCLAVHGCVLSMPGALLRSDQRSRLAIYLGTALLAALALHGIYHPIRPPPPPPPPPGELDAAQLHGLLAIDRGRRFGRAEAPLIADFKVDVRCPHCARDFVPLMRGLGPALEAGQVELVLRFAAPGDRPDRLRELAVAAAFMRRLLPFASATIGRPAASDSAAEDAALPEDFAEVPAQADRLALAIATLVALDQEQMIRLGIRGGASPQMVLRRRADGRELGRWRSHLPLPAIAAMIQAKAGQDGPGRNP